MTEVKSREAQKLLKNLSCKICSSVLISLWLFLCKLYRVTLLESPINSNQAEHKCKKELIPSKIQIFSWIFSEIFFVQFFNLFVEFYFFSSLFYPFCPLLFVHLCPHFFNFNFNFNFVQFYSTLFIFLFCPFFQFCSIFLVFFGFLFCPI